MRTLILMRGAPGSGKSTFIQNQGWSNYVIEPDALRLQCQSPKLTTTGSLTISQSNDKFVWETLFTLLENRMQRGEFTVIDATHSRSAQFNKYRELVRFYRYRVYCIDFSQILLAIALAQNKLRPLFKQVPDSAIESIHARIQSSTPPSWVTTIPYDEYVPLTLNKPDFSNYDSVKVYGDIHGCADILPVIDSESMHIFLGDYLDRGLQNVEVFRFLDSIKELDNVLLLEGNHERHYRAIIKDKSFDVKLPKYTRLAMDQLASAGVTPADIKSFYHKLIQCAYFSYKGQDYICTHGGIPVLPSLLVPTDDYVYGTGGYGDSEKVDASFHVNHPDTISIHGHRNTYHVYTKNTPGTYNLCGDPEFGGDFRHLKISDVIQWYNTPNKTFDKALSKLPATQTTKVKTIGSINPQSVLAEFILTPGIDVKQLPSGIKSVNFTNKLFKSGKWTDLSVKARGLFLDSSSNIVARSYDKFFNYKERPETKADAIQNLAYPLTVYIKENGFLGILSVHNDEWFIASKSTDQGPFAQMFRELVTPYLTPELKQYITDNNCSLIFEVNHLDDPHMVKYDKSHIVLLDVTSNVFAESRLDYLELSQTFAPTYGFQCKQVQTVLSSYLDWRAFRESEQSKSAFDPNVEGWVIEDANGFKFKLKSKYYSFWKYMRTIKDRIYKTQPSQYPQISAKLHAAEDFKLFNFFTSLPKEDLTKDIISLRDIFNSQ